MTTALEKYLDVAKRIKDRKFVYANARKLLGFAKEELAKLEKSYNDSGRGWNQEFEATFITPLKTAIKEVEDNLVKYNLQ
jgi:hypothetical protein